MQSFIVVMFIWVGNMHGGPAVIQGFNTIDSCKDRIPEIRKIYSEAFDASTGIVCKTIQK